MMCTESSACDMHRYRKKQLNGRRMAIAPYQEKQYTYNHIHNPKAEHQQPEKQTEQTKQTPHKQH